MTRRQLLKYAGEAGLLSFWSRWKPRLLQGRAGCSLPNKRASVPSLPGPAEACSQSAGNGIGSMSLHLLYIILYCILPVPQPRSFSSNNLLIKGLLFNSLLKNKPCTAKDLSSTN